MKPKDILQTDTLLSDRVRMVIMATLAAAKNPLDFNSLIDILGVSKGNLSSHVRKLDEAGFVNVNKEFVERKPRTTYTVTKKGKKALNDYLQMVETLLVMSQTKGGGL